MDSFIKETLEALPADLRQLIDAHITARLIAFHQALIERGQVRPIPDGQVLTDDYTADHNSDEDRPE